MKWICKLCNEVFDTDLDHNINTIDLGVHISKHMDKMILPSKAMEYFKRD